MDPLSELNDGLNSYVSKKDIVVKTFNRNEFIKQPNVKDTNIYFIKSGTIRIFKWNKEKDITIRFGYQGEIIASLDSLFLEKESPLCFQALKKTEVHIFKKVDFNNFLNSKPKWLVLWNTCLQLLIIQQMEREFDLLLDSPTERMHRVLERSPRLFQEIPSKYIASYLRMTPETLSRLRKG